MDLYDLESPDGPFADHYFSMLIWAPIYASSFDGFI
jgi:hypothetical protein